VDEISVQDQEKGQGWWKMREVGMADCRGTMQKGNVRVFLSDMGDGHVQVCPHLSHHHFHIHLHISLFFFFLFFGNTGILTQDLVLD
jgi:hypothetical protein